MTGVLDSGDFILGPEVAALEEDVAEYLEVEHAIAVASGTDALWLAAKTLGFQAGDRVLTTPFTFFATASALLNVGAEVVLADIQRNSFNLAPEEVRVLLEEERSSPPNKRIKAIVVVHLYGSPADMDEFNELSEEFGVPLIEDCAQAFGARFAGRKVGTLSSVGTFSFFPSKNLGGFGDGGLVATDDEDLANKARSLRAHGATKKYVHELVGTNSRLDSLQAALLRRKLPYVDLWNEQRRDVATRYSSRLSNLDEITVPSVMEGQEHVFHQYTIRVEAGREERDRLSSFLSGKGVGNAVYYPFPLHQQPALRDRYGHARFPEAEQASDQVLSLPIFPGMTSDEVDYCSARVEEFFLNS